MDKRHVHRRASSIDFKVFDVHGGQLLGRLGDLSADGMLLYGDQVLPLNQKFDVAVEYPDEDGTLRRATLHVLSLWSKPDYNPTLHLTGMQIARLDDPQAAEALKVLLDRFTVGGADLVED